MSALIIKNELVHYEVLGRGRPIVFLHGWAGSWRDWIYTMQAASASFRCYALDLWGFGDTSKAQELYAIEDQARLVDDFMNELGIGKIALVGHGLGAIVAAHFATLQPQFVDRLMLVGYPLSQANVTERIARSSAIEVSQWLLDGVPDEEAIRREAAKVDPAAVQASIEHLRQADHGERLKRIELPCLLVYGENDQVVSPPGTEILGLLQDLSHNMLLENAGHYPMLRDTAKFSRLLTDFLSLRSGESPRSLQLKDEWKRRFR